MEKEDDHKSNVFWLVLGNTINMEIYIRKSSFVMIRWMENKKT